MVFEVIFIALVLGVIDPIFAAVVVAIIAPIGAYLAAARKMSGKIHTSEATDLWAESKAIREWSQQEILDLRAALKDCLARIASLEAENKDLRERLDQHAAP
jgi:hypothetical protein